MHASRHPPDPPSLIDPHLVRGRIGRLRRFEGRLALKIKNLYLREATLGAGRREVGGAQGSRAEEGGRLRRARGSGAGPEDRGGPGGGEKKMKK